MTLITKDCFIKPWIICGYEYGYEYGYKNVLMILQGSSYAYLSECINSFMNSKGFHFITILAP